MKSVNVGMLGLGTVGCGTANVLQRNADEISRRAGRGIRITKAAVRTLEAPRRCSTDDVELTTDPFEVVNDPDIDVVVELIGGYDTARDLVMAAIDNGKHVITANKALIALYGNEIFARAQEKGIMVAFEAAVAGGIPIIKAIREGLAGNRIEWLAGIINGTGNYILTEMRDKGREFDDVLAEAQELGYAEADPTFDIEGIDAAHKLTILASIAFGIPLQFDKTFTEGISRITREDVEYADELGYAVKHLGIARREGEGIELRVDPTLIPKQRLIANVNGVMNAIVVQGDAVGPTLYYGAGAGADPTASAVVADLVDTVRMMTADPSNHVPHLAFQPDSLADLPILDMKDVETAYYLRLLADDRPGVLAEITRILAEEEISIEALIQKRTEADLVPIILVTHKVQENRMNAAIEQLQSLVAVAGEIIKIRLETLD